MNWYSLDDVRAGVAAGFHLDVSPFAPAKATFWEFPRDRFIEYGPEDEWWAKKFDFGRPVRQPVAFQIGTTFFVHPDVYAYVVCSNLLDHTRNVGRWLQAQQAKPA